MSRHDVRTTLCQMLDHIEEAIELSESRTRTDLDSDRVFYLALLKLVEIAGEAASRVPASVQEQNSTIPWRELIGTRNRLVHGYDAVDHDILWTIVADDFRPLAEQIKVLLKD